MKLITHPRTLRPLLFVLFATAAFALIAACGGGGDDPSSSPSASTSRSGTPRPSATVTPTPTPEASEVRTATRAPQVSVTPTLGPTPVDQLGDERLILSLGDSLAYGNGASNRSYTSYIALITVALGDGYETINLAHAGDTSQELIDRQLPPAVAELQARAVTNNTAAILLEIGGNDLLDLYESLVLTGLCPSVTEALQIQACVDGLRGALDNYRPHLEEILDQLKAAAPGVPIFLSTLYNPFSGNGGNLDQIGVLALEGQDGTPFPEGLNDVIRQVGAEKGATIVDWYPIFVGHVNDYIAQDIIHPNDTGHALMAQAVLDAMAAQGIL